MSKNYKTFYVVVSDDAPEEAVSYAKKEAVKRTSKYLDPIEIIVIRQSELLDD